MGFPKTLFLGVHTSNGIVKALFLPVSYVTLLSPFILAVAWYLGVGQTLQAYLSEDFSLFDILPQIALSAVFILLPTRLLSTSKDAPKGVDGGKRKVQALPYWIPGARHLGNLVLGGDQWLKSVRLVASKLMWKRC